MFFETGDSHGLLTMVNEAWDSYSPLTMGTEAGDSHGLLTMVTEAGEVVRISRMLELSPAVCQLSNLISTLSSNLDALRDSSIHARAAMCVFAASHLLGHPVTLDQLSQNFYRTRRSISDTYRLFYPERHVVSNDGEFMLLLREGSERAGTGSPTPPAWPEPEYADAIWDMMMTSHSKTAREAILSETYSGIVSTLAVKPYFNDDDDILPVIALSIYLAYCLRQTSVPCAQISATTGVSLGDLRAAYATFYPHREDLLECRALASSSIDNSFERLLADLPREID